MEETEGWNGKVKDENEIREGYGEDKTGTACIWVWRWGDSCEVIYYHNCFLMCNLEKWWWVIIIYTFYSCVIEYFLLDIEIDLKYWYLVLLKTMNYRYRHKITRLIAPSKFWKVSIFNRFLVEFPLTLGRSETRWR